MRDYVARYTDHVSMRMSVVTLHHETTSQHIYPAISLKGLQAGKNSRAVRTRRVHEHDGFMV